METKQLELNFDDGNKPNLEKIWERIDKNFENLVYYIYEIAEEIKKQKNSGDNDVK